MKRRLAGLLAWLEALASRRLGAVVLFAAGLAVYAIRAVAFPLKSGRDLDEYLLAYVQMFDRHVLLPWALLVAERLATGRLPHLVPTFLHR